MMNQTDLLAIAGEIRSYIERLKAEEVPHEEIRELVIGSMNHTTVHAYEQVMHECATNPENAVTFTFAIHQSLGGVNAVLIEEGHAPMTLKDMKFMREAIVSALEEYTGQDIDEVIIKLEEHQKGGMH